MPLSGYEDLPRLMRRMSGDEKHDAASSSTLDILWVLYHSILQVSPEMYEDRDRFFLSKGHGPMAYYAVLAAKGFIRESDLDSFGAFSSILGHHPDRTLIPGVEMSSGSLGHGLPLALGVALGLRAQHIPGSTWVLVGDGELDEGSNHEAIALSARMKVDSLHVVVVDNQSATHGWPHGIETRFQVEGWETVRVSAHDHDLLEKAMRSDHSGRPLLVVAESVPKPAY